ncbi:hypothetical protein IJ531_02860 [bacterium]|nr:hypothetical protein [bacterium]
MEISQVGTASVSNTNPQQTRSAQENDTEGIFDLINELDFKIDEKDKQSFFEELESVLESEHQKGDDSNNYSALANFFMKYAASGGKISIARS